MEEQAEGALRSAEEALTTTRLPWAFDRGRIGISASSGIRAIGSAGATTGVVGVERAAEGVASAAAAGTSKTEEETSIGTGVAPTPEALAPRRTTLAHEDLSPPERDGWEQEL